MDGWIKLHRKFIDWEWFNSAKHVKLFIYMLLIANHKETKWRGRLIKPGQILTGRLKLATGANLTERSVRTILKDLNSTNVVTIETTRQFSIITINNWEQYQANDQQVDQQTTNKRPTNDQQTTTSKNDKNVKNDKKIYILRAKQVLSFLNETTGRNYREVDTNLDLIIDRLKSDVSYEQCETVIAYKYNQWHDDPKMRSYLRPSTLFNKTKFEQYLPEAWAWREKQEAGND